MTTRRRQAGEGTISHYQVTARPELKDDGTRYLIKLIATGPDGERKQVLRRGFRTRKDAQEGLHSLRKQSEKSEGFQEPSKQLVGDYLAMWLDGLRLAPQTMSSYRRLVRLHMTPHIGNIPLARLTPTRVKALYRHLESEGRADGAEGGLSAKSVRYIATVLHKAVKDAVTDGLIASNPCDKADPPPARAAISPEMTVWEVDQVRQFLGWAPEGLTPTLFNIYQLGLATGARRGELLALRWSDVSLDSGDISIRRSLGTIRRYGSSSELIEGPTKAGKPRVVTIDETTVSLLRAFKRTRAALDFSLATGDALVFGNEEGEHLLPDSVSGAFIGAQTRFRKWQAERVRTKCLASIESLPRIRFHDIRHTHATILLRSGVHVKVVSERLGHSNPMTTMQIYSHVLPTIQREAADAIGRAIYGA
jgi:integrase